MEKTSVIDIIEEKDIIKNMSSEIQLRFKSIHQFVESFSYDLPIMKIDNILVSCKFEISKYSRSKDIGFTINSKNNDKLIYFSCYLYRDCTKDEKDSNEDNNYKIRTYNDEEIELGINKFLEILPTLKFYKLYGVFQTIIDFDYPINNKYLIQNNKMPNYWRLIIKSENVESIYQKCSVCHDETETKTSCNHSLCYECWDKLMVHQNEYYSKKCPICRNNLSSEDD